MVKEHAPPPTRLESETFPEPATGARATRLKSERVQEPAAAEPAPARGVGSRKRGSGGVVLGTWRLGRQHRGVVSARAFSTPNMARLYATWALAQCLAAGVQVNLGLAGERVRVELQDPETTGITEAIAKLAGRLDGFAELPLYLEVLDRLERQLFSTVETVNQELEAGHGC